MRIRHLLPGIFILLLTLSGCGDDSPSAVHSVFVFPGETVIVTDTTTAYRAVARDSRGTTMKGVAVEWHSNAPQIAQIDGSGVITGIAPGIAEITANVEGVRSAPKVVTVVGKTTVTGTAASGEPIAGATVTLRDKLGRIAVATTSADGTYSIASTKMSPPFLVCVDRGSGAGLIFSVSNTLSADAAINVTPITDLIVRTWLKLSNQSSVAANSSCSTATMPLPATVNLVAGFYADSLAFWLQRFGVDSGGFDPISTPFVADNSGIDHVLHLLEVDVESWRLLVQDGSIQETVNVTIDADTGSVSATTTRTGSKGRSGAALRTFVPVSASQQHAIQTLDQQVNALGSVVREKGEMLSAGDILPFLNQDFLHNGLDRNDYAAAFATVERGRTSLCGLRRIDQLAADVTSLTGMIRCQEQKAQVARTDDRSFQFTGLGGNWLIRGNQRLAMLNVATDLQNMQGSAAPGPVLRISMAAVAPAGTISDATVYGSGLGANGAPLMQRAARALSVSPEPDNTLVIERERYFARSLLPDPQSAQLGFEFTITPTQGEAAVETVNVASYTTELITLTGANGASLAEASLGQPLQVQWELPETLVVQSVQLLAQLFIDSDASSPDCIVSGQMLGTTQTSGTITIPDACNGMPMTLVKLVVVVSSPNGLQTSAVYAFQGGRGYIPAVMDLPVVRIVTDGQAPVVSKEEYVHGTLSIAVDGGEGAVTEIPLRIRGRGNSTWSLPKKPYKLKLDSKAALLDMPADKDWVLLANYTDKSMLRTQMAFEFGHRLGMSWTPRFRYVELFLNDEYMGTYQLGEGIKVAESRVDIEELDEEDIAGNALTGGYLVEIDARLDGEFNFTTARGVPFVIDTPDPPITEQFAYIRGFIQEAEDVLYSDAFTYPDSGYAHYLDVDSFINWYLVNELLKNNDAIFWSSCWMYKERDGKLIMGPLWDFDISAGNINYNGNDNPAGWWIRHSPWISRLFEDPAFVARVRARWNELKASQIDTIFTFIDDGENSLSRAAYNNFQRWPILEEWVWPNAVVTGSYSGEVDYLRSWVSTRIAWMDSQFNP